MAHLTSTPAHPTQTLTGLIFNVMRFALNDGAGIRTTVFFKGCPLNCRWCHNPESQSYSPEILYSLDRCLSCKDCCSACKTGALQWDGRPVRDRSRCTLCEACILACPADARKLIGKRISVSELMEVIARDQVFYEESGGGVTFSGGEPLAQPEFLEAALLACHDRQLRTAVDTSGYVTPSVLSRIAGLTQEFLFDLKMMDDTKHRWFVGVSNEIVLHNLALLSREHPNVKVRVPVIPGINDDDVNLEQSCRFLEQLGLRQLDLLPYHEIGVEKYKRLDASYGMAGVKPPTAERMLELAARCSARGFIVRIGG
ncbi:MAG TPA: glycyl-radical enzyme activating protein [Terriglobales bacterium]|nr:glycyl-radical enzyme activating protein [Terriglobales bacterium]